MRLSKSYKYDIINVMFSEIDLKYESGRHLLGSNIENTLANVMYGDYQASLWPESSWGKIQAHSTGVIGVDSLRADTEVYFDDIFSELELSIEEKAVVDRLLISISAWASLPESVQAVNGRDSILQVHGDVSTGGKGYISIPEVFVASLLPVLGISTFIAGVKTEVDYRSQKKKDNASNKRMKTYNRRVESLRLEYNLDTPFLPMQEISTSRRHFLKSSVESLVWTTLGVNGLLNIARRAESSNTPVQGVGETIVDKTPGILYPNRHSIIGRTALVAEKTEEAARMFDTPNNRASILFGNAHSIGLEVVHNQDDRVSAIRMLADIFFDKKDVDEVEGKRYTREDVIQKLADTKVVTVNEVDTKTAKTNPTIAVFESVDIEDRYHSPSILAILDSWDPNEHR
jgi:hypothetical protein